MHLAYISDFVSDATVNILETKNTVMLSDFPRNRGFIGI